MQIALWCSRAGRQSNQLDLPDSPRSTQLVKLTGWHDWLDNKVIYGHFFFKVPHLGKLQNEFGRMPFRKKLQMDQDLSFLEG